MIEKWEPIKDYPKYQVSNTGRVKSFRLMKDRRRGTHGKIKEKILIPNMIDGYAHVTLLNHNGVKLFRIHRLVLMAFLSNPENKPDVNHINGIRHDNRLCNLEWCTKSENLLHAYRIGLAVAPTYTGCFDKPVLAVKETSIIEFRSISDCSRALLIPRGSMQKIIDSERLYKGYTIYSL